MRMSNSNNFVDRDACLSSAASPANSNDETVSISHRIASSACSKKGKKPESKAPPYDFCSFLTDLLMKVS